MIDHDRCGLCGVVDAIGNDELCIVCRDKAEEANVAAIVESIAGYDSQEDRRAHVAMRMVEFWSRERAKGKR